MPTSVIYTESQPGTLVYAFPKTDSLANWLTARVQLVESSAPNQGRWTGSLNDGEWSIFEGSAQPAGFQDSVWSYSIASSNAAGTGARTVTITVLLSGNPVEGATVRLVKAAESFTSTTNASGQAVFNVDDGTWTVSITASGATFGGASLVVDGTENVSYTVVGSSIPAPTTPGLTTVRVSVINQIGALAGCSVSVEPVEKNAAASSSLVSRTVYGGVTNGSGFVDLVMIQAASFTRGLGLYKLRVSDPAGKIISERTVTVPSVPSCYAVDLVDA